MIFFIKTKTFQAVFISFHFFVYSDDMIDFIDKEEISYKLRTAEEVALNTIIN